MNKANRRKMIPISTYTLNIIIKNNAKPIENKIYVLANILIFPANANIKHMIIAITPL